MFNICLTFNFAGIECFLISSLGFRQDNKLAGVIWSSIEQSWRKIASKPSKEGGKARFQAWKLFP